MLATATITYDLSDYGLADFDSRRTKVWATNNVNGPVIDTEGNLIHLGSANGTVNADGTGSITVPTPGTGSNPASWQTTIHVDYPDRNANRGRDSKSFGPFTITVDADLADLVTQMEIPPETLGGDAWLAAIDADDSSQYRAQQDARLLATIAAATAPIEADVEAVPAAIAAAVNNDQIAANGLTAWKSGVANRRLGPADIFVLGHSWIEGEGVTTREARILDRLREGLRSKYPTVSGGSLIVGGTGYLPCVNFESTWPSPWTLAGGASTDGYGIGGRCAVVDGVGETVSISGQFSSSFDLYWLPAGGSATISIDGGAATALPIAGSSYDVQRYNSGALGVGFHSITVTGTAAAASYIMGATFYENDESAGIRTYDSGHNGWQTSSWATYTSGGGFFTNHYTKLPAAPDLVLIMCLVNDYNLGAAPATTQANLAQIVSDLKATHAGKGWANPSFLIVGEIEPTSVVSPAYPWEDYLAAAAAVAAADADTEFINLSARLDTTADPQGTLAGDLLHPSAKGAGWIADVLAGVL